MLSRLIAILTQLAVKWVITLLIAPYAVMLMANGNIDVDAPLLVSMAWAVLTWPPVFYFGLFLLGWWSATAAMRYSEALDGQPSLLEQDRLRRILRRSRWSLWRAIPEWLQRREANIANKALTTTGFAAPPIALPEPSDAWHQEQKARAAYFHVLEILIRHLGFEIAKSMSRRIHNILLKTKQPLEKDTSPKRPPLAASRKSAAHKSGTAPDKKARKHPKAPKGGR
jgi:hypothetical protein